MRVDLDPKDLLDLESLAQERGKDPGALFREILERERRRKREGRPKRSDPELQRASDHFHYEYWMFLSLAGAMATGVFGKGNLANAVLESFTIHARAVLDVLYEPASVQPDDVLASDFFDCPKSWHDLRPTKTPLLEDVHRRVGKEVAHLTYARQQVTPEEKEWRFAEIAQDASRVATAFLNRIPKRLFGERWRDAAGYLKPIPIWELSLLANDSAATDAHPSVLAPVASQPPVRSSEVPGQHDPPASS